MTGTPQVFKVRFLPRDDSFTQFPQTHGHQVPFKKQNKQTNKQLTEITFCHAKQFVAY